MKAKPDGEWTDFDEYKKDAEYLKDQTYENIFKIYNRFKDSKQTEEDETKGYYIQETKNYENGEKIDMLLSPKGEDSLMFHGYIRDDLSDLRAPRKKRRPKRTPEEGFAERLVGDPPTLLKKPQAPPHRPKSKPKPKPYFFSPYAY